MRLFDTHAHLNLPDYEQDYSEVWERAKATGLIGLINVGTDLSTSKRGIEQAHELGVYASVGIHPNDAKQFAAGEEWKHTVEELVTDDKVVAVGEIGFDFFRQFTNKEDQLPLLEYFLDLAEKHDKPVLFHCREAPLRQGSEGQAYEELLRVLKGWKGGKGIRGVVHAFGGDESIAKQFLDLGLYLSFTAQVTYPKNEELYRSLVQAIPLDRILLETDCPFLPPEGLRGQRNEPRHVDVVAATIGKFLGKPTGQVAAVTTANAKKLFRLQ